VRVIAGDLRGRRLASPPRRTAEVRPTSDRARETLFELLGGFAAPPGRRGGCLSGLRVLDLFSGTGALAIEAISRGADSAALVDTRPALARRNVAELGIANRCEIVRGDAIRYLRRSSERFGLILCDPPYRLAARLEPDLVELLPPRLARHGLLAVESSARRPLDLDLRLAAERRFGAALIRIWQRP
jgi:16S rRNA (guanine966-N2)-methyltransferase